MQKGITSGINSLFPSTPSNANYNPAGGLGSTLSSRRDMAIRCSAPGASSDVRRANPDIRDAQRNVLFNPLAVPQAQESAEQAEPASRSI